MENNKPDYLRLILRVFSSLFPCCMFIWGYFIKNESFVKVGWVLLLALIPLSGFIKNKMLSYIVAGLIFTVLILWLNC